MFRSEGKFPERSPALALKAYREDRADIYIAGSVLNSNGQEWWDSRVKVQQPFLKPKNIANYVDPIGGIADSFTDRYFEIINYSPAAVVNLITKQNTADSPRKQRGEARLHQ